MNYLRISIVCAVLFAFGLIFGFIAFPAFLKSMIRKKVVLTPGSETRQMWAKFPIPIDFLIYVFNVTNPEQAAQGAKPIVHEIGPYYFDEWKEKYNLEDNEEEDTVTFNMRQYFIFRPDKSNGLTGEEVITIPHPLIQPLAVVVKRDRAPMLQMIADGLKALFPGPSPFLTGKFMDIFFRGILLDCSTEDFGAKAICLQFHTGEVKGGVQYNATHFLFSLMSGANGTDAGRFTVYRGKKHSLDVGRVIQFAGESEMSVWDDDEELGQKCNQFKGTDSTIFAPLMKKEDGLWAFAADLCRSLGPKFERDSSYMGIPTLRYILDFGDLKNEPEHHCYCENPPDGCPPKGTMTLKPCVGAPMIVSLPHFLNADSSLVENVIGLGPHEDKHGVYLEFEIMSGTPLAAAKRLQFSIDIEPVAEVEPMKNIRKMVMPLFWVEESANLNKTFVDLIKNTLFLGLKINNGIRWTFTIFGGIGFAICMYMHTQKSKVQVLSKETVVKPTSAAQVATVTARRNAVNDGTTVYDNPVNKY